MKSIRTLFGSTRVRITIVSVVVVGVALGVGGLILNSSLHSSALRAVKGSAAVQASWVESLGTAGTLPDPLPAVDASRLTLVQVVDANRHVIAASSQLAGVEYDADRGGEDGVRIDAGRGQHHRLRGGPWFAESAKANVDGQTFTVVAFTSLADYERALDSVERALAISFPVLLLLVAAATWLLVGRSLRPVERMRQEVDAISAGNLDARVVEPPTADEVGRLAVTLNAMLQRLQLSADRQRRFIADASHELRTPVANVAAALDVARRYPDQADWTEVGSDVAAQNQRMARLVDDLLLIARTEHASERRPPGPVELGPLVRGELEHLSAEAQALIHLAEPLPSVVIQADAQPIGRIVANLLENATRHANSRVDVSIQHDADTASITVADDGPGVPLEHRERVFEAFVRLDDHRSRPDGGAGLGLAIVRDLVTDAGGTVTLADGPSGGAAFTVSLPRTLSA